MTDRDFVPHRRKAALGLLAAVLLGACATPGPEPGFIAVPAVARLPECLQPGQDTRASIVRIATDVGAHGSGVVVARDRVLTAAHVVVDAGVTRVAPADSGGYRPARVLGLDAGSDLALLETDTGDVPAVPITHRSLTRYEDVWAIGFPLALDMAVSQGRYQHAANGKLYTSAWITAGVSGGGLIRCNHGAYELAGIMRDYVALLHGDAYVNASQSTSTPAESILSFIHRVDPVQDQSIL